jgi:PhnB protein
VAVKPVPDGYHTVTPYLTVHGADRLLDFVKQAFGAEEMVRMNRPDGSIQHAEVQIGDSRVMLGEPTDQWGASPATIHLYLDDCDAIYERALDAGATSLREPTDEFYGDRMGGVRDPLGNSWWIATHIEDVPDDEMARRAEEWESRQS